MTPTPDPAEALAREAVALFDKASECGWPENDEKRAHAGAMVRDHAEEIARDLLDKSERLRAAEGLLREREWARMRYVTEVQDWRFCCIACDGLKPDHAPDCALAAHLASQPAREAT